MKTHVTEGSAGQSEEFGRLCKQAFKLTGQFYSPACCGSKVCKCRFRPVAPCISIPCMLPVIFTDFRHIFYICLQKQFCFPQMIAPLSLDAPYREACSCDIFQFEKAAVHLIHRLIDAGDRCVQLTLVGTQLLHKALFCIDHVPGFLQYTCLFRVKGAHEFGYDVFFIGFIAVQLKTEITKSGLYKLVINNIQSCLLFGDKEHFLPVVQAFRYDIRDCLTLAGSRRSLQYKTLSPLCHKDSFHLTGVSIDDCVKRDKRIFSLFRDILIFALNRLSEQSQDIVILKNRLLMINQVVIHVDLEE